MLWDLINREKLRRALLYLLYVLLCLLAQDSIFASLPLFGVNMFFLPAAAVAIGMFEDGVWGAAFGLVLGMTKRQIFFKVTLLLKGHELGAMLWTAVVQLVWSLPMTAALYFPCKAIARKKI